MDEEESEDPMLNFMGQSTAVESSTLQSQTEEVKASIISGYSEEDKRTEAKLVRRIMNRLTEASLEQCSKDLIDLTFDPTLQSELVSTYILRQCSEAQSMGNSTMPCLAACLYFWRKGGENKVKETLRILVQRFLDAVQDKPDATLLPEELSSLGTFLAFSCVFYSLPAEVLAHSLLKVSAFKHSHHAQCAIAILRVAGDTLRSLVPGPLASAFEAAEAGAERLRTHLAGPPARRLSVLLSMLQDIRGAEGGSAVLAHPPLVALLAAVRIEQRKRRQAGRRDVAERPSDPPLLAAWMEPCGSASSVSSAPAFPPSLLALAKTRGLGHSKVELTTLSLLVGASSPEEAAESIDTYLSSAPKQASLVLGSTLTIASNEPEFSLFHADVLRRVAGSSRLMRFALSTCWWDLFHRVPHMKGRQIANLSRLLAHLLAPPPGQGRASLSWSVLKKGIVKGARTTMFNDIMHLTLLSGVTLARQQHGMAPDGTNAYQDLARVDHKHSTMVQLASRPLAASAGERSGGLDVVRRTVHAHLKGMGSRLTNPNKHLQRALKLCGADASECGQRAALVMRALERAKQQEAYL
eukprot:gnl/Dysnectes_brevis/3608_a4593_545.p1 GENE.gnl/Dysnectes_brevis/3608_a4593_545~~gnl/Dysnectes_brevis/3608_a4593_545.p1  ORF type:complete len:630 (-),score=105.99 gnl/Dysnectes_brevis/3608_a4593_545:100-1842(-)